MTEFKVFIHVLLDKEKNSGPKFNRNMWRTNGSVSKASSRGSKTRLCFLFSTFNFQAKQHSEMKTSYSGFKTTRTSEPQSVRNRERYFQILARAVFELRLCRRHPKKIVLIVKAESTLDTGHIIDALTWFCVDWLWPTSNCEAWVWLCEGNVKSVKSNSEPCVSAPMRSASSVSKKVSVCELGPYASTLMLSCYE